LFRVVDPFLVSLTHFRCHYYHHHLSETHFREEGVETTCEARSAGPWTGWMTRTEFFLFLYERIMKLNLHIVMLYDDRIVYVTFETEADND
jgi:hypothetical protein